MPGPRVCVEQRGDEQVVRPVDRPLDLVAKFHEVVSTVNRGLRLPPGEQRGPRFQALYDEGPALFDEMFVDPKTGKSHTQLGGLQVSQGRLGATLARLRELGFDVLQ